MFVTLRSKIVAGYTILVAVNLVFTLWAVNRFSTESSAATGAVGSYADRSTRLLQISTVVSRLLAESVDRSGDGEEDPLRRQRALLAQLLPAELDTSSTGFDSSLVEIARAVTRFDSAVAAYRLRPATTDFDRIEAAHREVLEEIESAGALSTRLLARGRAALSESIRSTLATITLASLVAGIIGILAGIAYARWALQSIERLRTAVRHVSEGEFSQRIHITTADELGDLSFDFNRMIERLHRYQAMNVESILLERRKAATVVRSIGSPILVVDRAGRLLLANSAALRLFVPSGSPPGSPPGSPSGEETSLTEIVTDHRLRDPIIAALSSERQNPDRFSWAIEREGESRHYTVTLHRFGHDSESKTRGEQVGGVIVLLTDVTEFKALDAMKSDILARVSHELRTPLSSTLMSVDLLREGILGELDPRQAEMILAMKTDLRRLSSMIDEILRAARIDSLVPPASLSGISFDAALEETLQRHGTLAGEGGVDFRIVDEAPENLRVRMLPEHLRLIVDNLLSNAIRFAGRGGEVVIRLGIEAGYALIEVSDTGPGIPLSEQERIFERFYQVDRGEPNPPGSIGLGLSMVRDVVARYDGSVTVSGREGEGACFTVRIPPAIDEQENEEELTDE